MIEDTWEPTKEDIDWTDDHLDKMNDGDTWGVADAVLRKTGHQKMEVVSMTSASLLPLQRIAKVLKALDVELDLTGAELVEDAQAAAQASAQEWTCTHEGCEERLANFDLESGEWVVLDADSESWRVLLTHTGEDGEEHQVAVAPMDYHLLAGDDLFFSWKGHRVLERHEIIDMADEGRLLQQLNDGRVFIMPTVWKEHHTEHHTETIIPPHLRGLIFVFGDEEE